MMKRKTDEKKIFLVLYVYFIDIILHKRKQNINLVTLLPYCHIKTATYLTNALARLSL